MKTFCIPTSMMPLEYSQPLFVIASIVGWYRPISALENLTDQVLDSVWQNKPMVDKTKNTPAIRRFIDKALRIRIDLMINAFEWV